jgi:hypothetical protein
MGGGLRLWGKTPFAVTATLSTVLIVGWFIGRLGEATLRWHTLDLEVISVPKRVADQGFTGQVVTQRLREAISTVLDQAQTTMAKTSADVPDRSAVEHAVPRRARRTVVRLLGYATDRGGAMSNHDAAQ